MKQITLPQYSVKEKLPEDRQLCLWYDAHRQEWRQGIYYSDVDNPPGLFSGYGAGYVFDGKATHWMPIPTLLNINDSTP